MDLHDVRALRLDYTATEYPGPDHLPVLSWTVHVTWDDGMAPLPSWHPSADDEADDEAHVVGDLELYSLDVRDPDDVEELFDISDDLAHMGEQLMDASGRLRSDLNLDLADGFLVLDRVVLRPAWRGHGLGPYLASAAIMRLLRSESHVLVQPAPIERCGDRAEAVAKLTTLWSRLGFRPLTGDIHAIAFD